MAQLHARRIRGALAYYEGHRKRLVGAVGKDVFHYELTTPTLNATTVDPSGFTTTVVEVGAGTTEFDANNTAGRVGTITCAANENDGGQYQLLGEHFECTSDQDWYMGLEFQTNDADQTDLLFGACITDTTLLGGMTDGAYMESLDASASVSGVSEKDSTEEQTDSLGTITDATDQIWEIYWDGTGLYYFVDGVQQARHATTIPDDEALTLSLAFLTGEAVANTLNVKWCRAIQIGR